MNLRPYQERAVDAVRESWADSPLLVMPTGSGKTQVAAEILRETTGRSLIVAHTRAIVLQTAARFRECGLPVGVVMAEHRQSDQPITVASVQTLARRRFDPFDVVIIDEAHHATSPSYRRVLHGAFLGLTATPLRLDGRGLGAAGFRRIIEPVTYQELFDDGYLARPDVYAPDVPDMAGVHRVAGDFAPNEAEKRITGKLVDHYRDLCPNARAIAFACSIAHSTKIVTAFLDAGIPAEHLDGDHDPVHREAVLARLKSGDTRVLANCSLLGEGWDLPELEACIMARPTLSITVYRQQAGRVMRPLPGKQSIILDHAGNSLRLGMPWDPQVWTLEGKPPGDPGVAPCRRCPKCFRVVYAATPSCPECGHVFVIQSQVPVETCDRLRKITSETSRREWYADRVFTASIRGYRLGWARVQFKECYGAWPRGMREIEARYRCPEHEPKRQELRTRDGFVFRVVVSCARCLRTLDPTTDPASGR